MGVSSAARSGEGRKDLAALTDNLKHQLDMVENAGFSPKVMQFFRTIPILATETDCLDIGATIACYSRAAPSRSHRPLNGVTVWDHDQQKWTNPDIIDLAADSGLGEGSASQAYFKVGDND